MRSRLLPASIAVAAAAAARASNVSIVINNAWICREFGLHLSAQLGNVQSAIEINAIASLQIAQAFAPVLAVNGEEAWSTSIQRFRGWQVAAPTAGSRPPSGRLPIPAAGFGKQHTLVIGVHLGFTNNGHDRGP